MKFKERLNQRARELQMAPRRLLQHYAMERFLYRLSLSPYSQRLYLKGGMLLEVFSEVMEFLLAWLAPVMTSQPLRRWKPGKGWK